MFEKVKTFYKGVSFETLLLVQLFFAAFAVAGIIAVSISNSNTQKKIEGDFLDRCSAACYPNTVYSIEYKRCSCNAAVVVREVK